MRLLQFRFSRRFVGYAVLTVLWMAVIFLFSVQNADDSSATSGKVLTFLCGLFGYTPAEGMKETLSFLVRKAAHMTEFGILSVLWLHTLRTGWQGFRHDYPTAFVLASVYAATDEYHQLFVDGRAGQVTDWLIDSMGIWLWITAVWLLMKITGRDKSEQNNDS